jgi:hypothetical protein
VAGLMVGCTGITHSSSSFRLLSVTGSGVTDPGESVFPGES